MKPDKPEPREPLDQNELQKLPVATMAKSMRNIEDIMADYIAGQDTKLSPDEERLLDLKIYEKTGKHIDKFKEKPKEPVNPNMITIGKNRAGAPSPTAIGKTAKAKLHESVASTSESVS